MDKVEIEFRTGPARSNGPRSKAEKYPFAELGMSELMGGDSYGSPTGPCFFIPAKDKPDTLLTHAKKTYRDGTFVSRRATKQIDGELIHGVYVWKVPLLPKGDLRRRQKIALPQPEVDPETFERRRKLVEAMDSYRLPSSRSADREPNTAAKTNEITQLVLSFLLQHERAPHKWMGRASVLRNLRS